jgi:hypothetical protein
MPEKSATPGLAEPTRRVVDAPNGRDVQATISSLEVMRDALGPGDERLGIVRVASYTDSDEAHAAGWLAGERR